MFLSGERFVVHRVSTPTGSRFVRRKAEISPEAQLLDNISYILLFLAFFEAFVWFAPLLGFRTSNCWTTHYSHKVSIFNKSNSSINQYLPRFYFAVWAISFTKKLLQQLKEALYQTFISLLNLFVKFIKFKTTKWRNLSSLFKNYLFILTFIIFISTPKRPSL